MLAAGGCAQTIAESRVRAALVDAGIAAPTADCMAGRMADRLSLDQLRRLERLKQPTADVQEASLEDYVSRVARVGDAEVVTVTASSAALCAAGLGG